MRLRLSLIGLLAAAATAGATAADMPYGVLDIGLGASYARLERELDFRDLDASLAYEALTNIGDDHQEAVRAFQENRKPKFTGR